MTAKNSVEVASAAGNARLSYADLAAATGTTPATAARRLAELRARDALFSDVDVDPALLGITVSALLWIQVAPAHPDAVATAPAGHEELAVVAATTGPTDLVAHALCRDAADLHHYLTRRPVPRRVRPSGRAAPVPGRGQGQGQIAVITCLTRV
ncbi:Lrp/AsnC family transcriptional regulator [Kitasatospora paranensis]|uniref:Lrp/AsnC family transcriptional regulator n=1 Tax=Kitasatospora paranensis TaxID=258053 RepID=A0ABW2FNA5_9ACTN